MEVALENLSNTIENFAKIMQELKDSIPDSKRPDNKSNNWYKLHDYRMTRRVGKKYVNRRAEDGNCS